MKSDQRHIGNNDVQTSKINLGIVCPMANEKSSAVEFVNEVIANCQSFGFKSITFFAVLDNVSKDGTIELLRNLEQTQPPLKVVWAPENRSVVDAYLRGYREAIAAGCDWILEIDAGYSHRPAEIPRFIEKMLEGYDCVFGSRFCSGGLMESPFRRRFISRGGTMLTNLLLGTKLKDMTSGFEMFSRDALQKALDKGINSSGHFFQTEIKTHCRNLKIAEVPIHYQMPSDSVNNNVLKDAFNNLWRMFRQRLAGRL